MNSHAKERWRLTTKLISGVRFENENPVHFRNPEDSVSILFANPEELPPNAFPSYKRYVSHPVWRYDLTIEIDVDNEQEAVGMIWDRLDGLVARLSFAGSAPVVVEEQKSFGRIVNATELDNFVSIIRGEQIETNPIAPVLAKKDLPALAGFFINERFLQDGDERVARSMRWLQHSYLGQTIVDEFASLMLAFESLSHLLRPSVPQFWRCSHCKHDVEICPKCGTTTQRQGSGVPGMQWLVIDQLGWTKKEWKSLWGMRNKVMHGSHDLSGEEQSELGKVVPRLEQAVILGIKAVLRLADNVPPTYSRPRRQWGNAELRVEYRKREDTPDQ